MNKLNNFVDKINEQGENKILLCIYGDKRDLSLNYIERTNEEQVLTLYAFLKFYLKQVEKRLDISFEDMYFDAESNNNE